LPSRTPPAQRDLSLADLLLASGVVLLAFLLASTPARNSDLWLHLATGRAIADGLYRFQGDPFTQGPSTGWIAHSWLSDLCAYELFSHLGGSFLVFVKAALAALLAVLMLRLGKREGAGSAWAAVAAALALLALGGRMLLQPALLSAVLLAMTLALLQRGTRLRTGGAGWFSAHGPICLLFVLWANLDDWFLLGPFVLALYLVGQGIGAVVNGSASRREDLPGLGLALGVGLLGCLLTPFDVRGLTLPAELGLTATARVLQQDLVLRNLFLSPFDAVYFRVGAAWSIPGLAYLALVVLGGLSFLGSRDARCDWRLPVWLGLFGLSAWSARAVPFFAGAAGPILARNVQDLLRRYRPDEASPQQWPLAGLVRAAALVLVAGLLIAAWPGWLQGEPYERRGWVVLPDPSLRQAAETLEQWRKDGRLTEEDHGFNFSPEEANYFAWFSPAQKGILDSRLQTTPDAAADYLTVRRALLQGPPSKIDWRNVLRAHRINHLVLSDGNPERMLAVYRRLVLDSGEWFLIGLCGHTALFGWRDPLHTVAPPEDLRLSLTAEAYRPTAADRAPAEWPGRGPRAATWWQPFVTARPAGSPDRDRAALLLTHYQTVRPAALQTCGEVWEFSRIAAAVAASATPSLGLQQTIDLSCAEVLHGPLPVDAEGKLPGLALLALRLRELHFQQHDRAPLELLWLAIRAARRALHDNPDDAHAYLLLGQVYMELAETTRERGSAQGIPFLARLRSVQAAASFQQALLARPDLLPAHAGLATLYGNTGQIDLQARHLREVLRLTQVRGRQAEETPAEWERRIGRLRDEVKQVGDRLTRQESNYEVNAARLSLVDRAVSARTRFGGQGPGHVARRGRGLVRPQGRPDGIEPVADDGTAARGPRMDAAGAEGTARRGRLPPAAPAAVGGQRRLPAGRRRVARIAHPGRASGSFPHRADVRSPGHGTGSGNHDSRRPAGKSITDTAGRDGL
jgi:hypothetical protein